MNNDFDFGDAVAVEFGDFEREVLEIDALVESGKVALDLQKQSAKGIGIALNDRLKRASIKTLP